MASFSTTAFDSAAGFSVDAWDFGSGPPPPPPAFHISGADVWRKEPEKRRKKELLDAEALRESLDELLSPKPPPPPTVEIAEVIARQPEFVEPEAIPVDVAGLSSAVFAAKMLTEKYLAEKARKQDEDDDDDLFMLMG